MKKRILAILCCGIPVLIGGLVKLIRTRKRKLKKEEEDIMNRILENQKRLEAACEDHDEMTRQTLEMIAELKKRLNEEKELGIDPMTIDVTIPEEVGA